MREFFEKQKRNSYILIGLLAAVTAVFFIGFPIAVTDENLHDGLFALAFISLWGFIILLTVWSMKYRGTVYTSNFLKNRGLEHVLDDINPEQPTLPKSKIYCGSKALVSKKPIMAIPYSEIGWVYVQVQKLYGLVTINKTVHVCTRDGKHFVIRADIEEFKWLLENVLLKANPDIVIGFGAEQRKRYNAIKAAYKASVGK